MAVLVFGPYRLDTRALELRRGDRKLPLPPQPCLLLSVLASHAGRLVTREELREALWPKGVHVSYNLGLNSCLKQIRHALDDRVDAPEYIETLTGRGYRFLASVRRDTEAAGQVVRLAVLPFEPIGPSVEQAAPLAGSLTDDLLEELARQDPAGLELASEPWRTEPRADYVVTGRVRASGARMRVTIRLTDTATSGLCWIRTYDASLSDPIDLPVRLASTAAGDVRDALAARRTDRDPRLETGARQLDPRLRDPVDDDVHRHERPALVESR